MVEVCYGVIVSLQYYLGTISRRRYGGPNIGRLVQDEWNRLSISEQKEIENDQGKENIRKILRTDSIDIFYFISIPGAGHALETILLTRTSTHVFVGRVNRLGQVPNNVRVPFSKTTMAEIDAALEASGLGEIESELYIVSDIGFSDQGSAINTNTLP
jgi:hypothetical protein